MREKIVIDEPEKNLLPSIIQFPSELLVKINHNKTVRRSSNVKVESFNLRALSV